MVLIFFILVFITEILGTLSGFGSSVLLMPLAGMFFDFKTTLTLTSILHIFSTSAQIFMFRKEINWPLLIKIGIPSTIFVLIGAYLNDKVNLKYAQLAMGVFLLSFGLVFLLSKNFKLAPSTLNAMIGGSIAGFFAGLIGTGGAIRGATLAAFDLSKASFVGTSAGIDLAVDVSRAYVYLSNGYLEFQYFWYIPVLLILASSGAWTGKKLLSKISQKNFKRSVLIIIMCIGAFMIYGAIFNLQVMK